MEQLMCIYEYESLSSVQVLCIFLGWVEQTDADTPVAQKSALLSKPNDVKNDCVFVFLCTCNSFKCLVRGPHKRTLINMSTSTQTQKANAHIQSVLYVIGKHGWLHK